MGKLASLIVLVFGFYIEGCIAQRPWGAKRDSNFCYCGNYTGIDTLIKIIGYYSYSERESSRYDGKSFIFFKDGFFTYSPFSDPNMTVKNNGEVKKIVKPINGYFTGIYKINNDTIKAQFSNPPNAMSWGMTEIWFEIVDNNTLRVINVPDSIISRANQIRNTSTYRLKEEYLVSFKPLSILPNPDDDWIKERKWFWCNDALYKEWQRKRKVR